MLTWSMKLSYFETLINQHSFFETKSDFLIQFAYYCSQKLNNKFENMSDLLLITIDLKLIDGLRSTAKRESNCVSIRSRYFLGT